VCSVVVLVGCVVVAVIVVSLVKRPPPCFTLSSASAASDVDKRQIYGVPYLRLQGGANAVIIDPQAGDIGVCLFASRDISKIKSTRAPGNPGTNRRYDYADGLYLGGMLNAAPTQYVQFSASGIVIHSPAQISLTAPDISLTADTIELTGSSSVSITAPSISLEGSSGVSITAPTTTLQGGLTQTGGGAAAFSGSITVTGDVISAGTSLHTHIHTHPQGGNTGQPV